MPQSSRKFILKLVIFMRPSFVSLVTASLLNPFSQNYFPATILDTSLLNQRGILSTGSLRCFSQRQLFFFVTTYAIFCQYLLIEAKRIGGMNCGLFVISSSILSLRMKKPTEFQFNIQAARIAKTYTLSGLGELQTQSTPKNLLSHSDLSFSESLFLESTDRLTSSVFLELLLVTLSDLNSVMTYCLLYFFGVIVRIYDSSESFTCNASLAIRSVNFLACCTRLGCFLVILSQKAEQSFLWLSQSCALLINLFITIYINPSAFDKIFKHNLSWSILPCSQSLFFRLIQ